MRQNTTEEPLLYNLTLLAEPNGHGGIDRKLTITLSPSILDRNTVIEVISGSRHFRVIEETDGLISR